MTYLLWYDDSRKESAAKVTDAVGAYVKRFDTLPNVVLVSRDETLPGHVAGCAVRAEAYIRRNNYWIGREEAHP